MSDGFKPAVIGPQPDHTSEPMPDLRARAIASSVNESPQVTADIEVVVGHLMAGYEAVLAMLNHAVAVAPQFGGLGMLIARAEASLSSAQAAMRGEKTGG